MLLNCLSERSRFCLLFSLLVVLLFIWVNVQPTSAQNADEDPNPAPTAAVDLKKSRISFVSKVGLPSGLTNEEARKQAYEIAELEGLYQIAKSSLSFKDREKDDINWDARSGGCQYLNWLARAKFNRQPSEDGNVSVKITDESWLSYRSQAYKTKRLLYRKDVDGDGEEERIYLDGNSGLEIKRGQRLIGALYPLSSFQAFSIDEQTAAALDLPSPNFICYNSISSVKNATLKGDILSLEVALDMRESVYGLAGFRRLINKTYDLQIAKDDRSPFVNIVEPIGNKISSLKQVPLRGTIDAPAGILSASLTINGEKLWNTPLGLQIADLEIDLCVDLKPGTNKIEIDVADLEGRKLKKAFELYAVASDQGTKTRTLIVGPNYNLSDVSNSQKSMQVRQAFIERGFSVKTLPGAEAKAENIKKSLENIRASCNSSDLVVLYLIGNFSFDGKKLAFVSSDEKENFSINSDYLRQYRQSLPGARFMIIWDVQSSQMKNLPSQSDKNNVLIASQLDSSSCTALIYGMADSSKGNSNSSLTDLFLDSLNQAENDLFQAVRLTYPLLCSQELNKAKSEKKAISLPIFVSF